AAVEPVCFASSAFASSAFSSTADLRPSSLITFVLPNGVPAWFGGADEFAACSIGTGWIAATSVTAETSRFGFTLPGLEDDRSSPASAWLFASTDFVLEGSAAAAMDGVAMFFAEAASGLPLTAGASFNTAALVLAVSVAAGWRPWMSIIRR